MTKYDEISVLASSWGQRIFDARRQCQRAAFLVIREYANQLGCPLDRVELVKVGKDLQPTNERTPYSADIPLVSDTDGFWYCCFRVRYEQAGSAAFAWEQLRLGISVHDGIANIREKRDFEINLDDFKTAEQLFEYWTADTKAAFASPGLEPSRRIGFME